MPDPVCKAAANIDNHGHNTELSDCWFIKI